MWCRVLQRSELGAEPLQGGVITTEPLQFRRGNLLRLQAGVFGAESG